MDPLHKSVEQSQVTPLHDDIDGSGSRFESCFGLIDRNRDMVVELEFESGNGFVDGDIVVNNLNDFDEPEDDEFFVERRDLGLEFRDTGSDIRLITIDSGSDHDDDHDDDDGDDEGQEDEREIWGIDLNEEDVYVNDDEDDDGDGDDDDEDDVSVTIPFCWDPLQFDDRGVTPEEFDWEEVDGGAADEREILSTFAEADIDDENSDDNGTAISVSVSPMVSLEGLATGERAEGSGNLGWEVLLNSHTLEINFDAENREIYIVGDHDDYIQTTEYETLFEQFAEAGITALRLPPTSKSFIKNLPMALLDVANDEGAAVCAVCKEDMNIESKAVQLPCNHKYHSECIVPWLKVRNTCPVCRYELPTDDTEYEQRKSQGRTATTTSHDMVL